MIEIGMHKIYKNFGYKQVLKDINFEILTGDRVGIVGKNGSGKSTLFKMIMKKEFPDTGNITIRKQATIGYLEQIPTISDNDITVKDMLMSSFFEIHAIEQRMRALEQDMMHNNVDEAILNKYAKIQDQYIALGGYEVEEKLNKVITGFKLHSILDKPFAILSGGQKTIINLAQLILTEPDILLLDEPTNHLDITMLEWLENYLNKYRGTIVIISHDRYFLDRVTNKTILLDNSENRLFHGNYSYTKKAKELEKRLEKIEILDKPQLEKKKLPLNFLGERSSKEVLKVIDFGISFNNLSLFSKVNFTLYYQEKTVLLGNNGSGKTSFIKALLGNLNNYQGELKMAETVLIGYIPQEINFINNNDSILQTFCHEYPCLEGEARGILAKYSFYQDQVFKRVGNLSGGEKVLLKMAILMQHKVNLLILDEPTNHIDIETREILEDALSNYSGTLLFVSHDRYFIDKLAQRKLVIENNTINSVYCDYK